MNRRLSLLLLPLICAPFLGACRTSPPTPAPDTPRLVVLLVVDQLRPNLLSDYDTLFVGGLRRLLDQGFRFENATHDHAHTLTAPGHVTLSTGVYPARHGVVGNTWFEPDGDGWQSVYSAEDLRRTILGQPTLAGRGPANIVRAGLPDWIRASGADSRVVSISRKDRAAIGLAAQAEGEVYWLADEGGVFVTSDFYRSEYPTWVSDFNRRTMPRIYADTLWESLVPRPARALTRPDTSAWELDGVHTAFPHRPADTGDGDEPGGRNHWRFEYTPFPDRAVVALASEAIDALRLGQRESVDYLGVSLSQTDLVGHHFGPESREQLDNLLRLDAELERLFTALDERVGPDRWVLAFSSDHGVLDVPEDLAERGVAAERLTRDHRQQWVDAIRAGATAAGTRAEVARSVRGAVSALPFIAGAYTLDEVERAAPPDSFAVLFAHSYFEGRAVTFPERWGVFARFRPNTLQWGSAPATHGSPYYYDRHVPVIFLGAGIRPGTSSERIATVDVAPTLARLAGIPVPQDLDGRPLLAVLAGR